MQLNIKKLLQKRVLTEPERKKDKGLLDLWLKQILETEDNDTFAYISYNFSINKVFDYLKNSDNQNLRNTLSKFHIIGLFSLSDVFYITSIGAQLIILSKNKTDNILTGVYKKRLLPPEKINDAKIKDPEYINNFSFTGSFAEYIDKIEKYYNQHITPSDSTDYEFNFVDNIEEEILNAEFYTKQFINNSQIFSESKTKLSDIAEIIPVHHFGEPNYSKYKVFTNFKQPMILRDSDHQTNHKIQKGDILIGPRAQELKVCYISEKVKGTVYAPILSYVIHSKNEKYPQEFLYMYLNSETFKKYVKKFFSGRFVITLDKIKNLPIIDLSYDTEYYKKLCRYDQKKPLEYTKQEIDILKPEKLDSSIETEIILEEIKKFSWKSNQAIKDLFRNDVKEVITCFDAGAYKAAIVLAGSILEGFLLDWLNELQPNEDWLNKKITTTDGKTFEPGLNDFISEIDILTKPEWLEGKHAANEIKTARNRIHFLKDLKKREKIDKSLCEKIIKYLQYVIDSRENFATEQQPTQ